MEYDFSQQIKDFAKISQRNSCVPHYECVCSVLEAKVERNNDVSENQVTLEQLKKSLPSVVTQLILIPTS